MNSRTGTTCALVAIAALASCASGGEVAELPPVDPGAELLERAHALIRKEDFGEARALLEPELAARPDWAAGHVGLALTYVKEERWQSARQLLEKALELDPQQHKARLPLGWCLYYLGLLDPAREMVQSFLAEEPDYADAVYALSLIELEGQDLARAESLLRRVILLSRSQRDIERQALAHTRLADLYLLKGDASRARLELERSLKLKPDDALVHFKMSRVLRLLGENEAAEASRRSYQRLQQTAP